MDIADRDIWRYAIFRGEKMRTVYPNLRKKMQQNGIGVAGLARHCEIKKLSCLLKLWGILPWKFTEVVRICRLFGETDAELLFVRLDIIS